MIPTSSTDIWNIEDDNLNDQLEMNQNEATVSHSPSADTDSIPVEASSIITLPPRDRISSVSRTTITQS